MPLQAMPRSRILADRVEEAADDAQRRTSAGILGVAAAAVLGRLRTPPGEVREGETDAAAEVTGAALAVAGLGLLAGAV